MEVYNFVLVGAPASGKSTLAKLLAEHFDATVIEGPSRIMHEWLRKVCPDFSSMEAINLKSYEAFQNAYLSLLEAAMYCVDWNQNTVLLRTPIDGAQFTEWWVGKFVGTDADSKIAPQLQPQVFYAKAQRMVKRFYYRAYHLQRQLANLMVRPVVVMLEGSLACNDSVRNFDRDDFEYLSAKAREAVLWWKKHGYEVIELPEPTEVTPKERLDILLAAIGHSKKG